MLKQGHPPFASERILYRTHTRIISNQRLIIDGRMLRLSLVKDVRLVRSRWFWLLHGLRLAIIAGAIGSALAVVDSWDGFGLSAVLAAVVPLGLGWLAYVLPAAIPSHAICLKTDQGRVDLLSTSDQAQLATVLETVQGALDDLNQP